MHLFFATEATYAIGFGHFMRCFALAQEAAARGVKSTFVLEQISDPVRQRLVGIEANWSMAEPDLLSGCLRQQLDSEDWWVVDSYSIDADFLAAIRSRSRVMVFDDLCALSAYPCDLLVNASQAAHELDYCGKSDGARLLAGPMWSAIRREFQLPMQATSKSSQAMVLMLGGSDPRGLTEPVARYLLSRFPTHSLAVVAGPAYRGLESLQRIVAQMDRLSLHVNPENLAELLTSCDLVVTAAGGSVGELCALGQMAVCLVVVDNQMAALKQCPYPVVDARQYLPLNELGDQVAKALGSAHDTLETRARAHKLVDGKGCERILDVMQVF